MRQTFDVVVVGGGLAGLSTATYLGRAGLSTIVIEKAKELGGRARTSVEQGFSFNQGAHAVYRHGHAWRVLEELGVPLIGGIPKTSGTLGIAPTGVHAMPVGLLSLLTTGLLPLAGKLEVSRLLMSLDSVDAKAIARVRARAWIEQAVKSEEARGFLSAFFRVGTYTGDLERLSAGAAISQLQLVTKHNVLYLDGGWQVLVHAMRERATAAGAALAAGDGAARMESDAHGKVRVLTHDGQTFEARAAVLAVGPRAAAAIAPHSAALAEIAERAAPTKVATLDLALSSLPNPRVRVAFGTERPLYFSVHSAVAKLAPDGGALVHVMRYGAEGDPRATEQELEEVMDLLQPGWREVVKHRRFLPAMVASNDLVAAERGGLAGRPDVVVPDAGKLFITGDWVGPEGMLLDAALASSKRAAFACAAALASRAGTTSRNAPGSGEGEHAKRPESSRAMAGDGSHASRAPDRSAAA